MEEVDVETIVQRAPEKYPGGPPCGRCPLRLISDNGPQFIAQDFESFIRLHGMTHVRTSPYYPQSNGKLAGWHASLKKECLRPAAPSRLEEPRRRVSEYVDRDNHQRLHSAIGDINPTDKLNGLEELIFAERDRKLEQARARRQQARLAMPEVA